MICFYILPYKSMFLRKFDNYFILTHKLMCFIKKAFKNQTQNQHDCDLPTQPRIEQQLGTKVSSYEPISDYNGNSSYTSFFNPDHYILSQMLGTLLQNESLLTKLDEKCSESTLMLDEACREAEKEPERQGKSEGKWKAHDKTIEKLFGSREYRFRLRLKNKFPTTIYKERNLAIAVELVDVARNCVMNANLVHLGATACNSDGVWIPETESGASFLQGKTETDLYHGEASFDKLSPRDVSRALPGGRMHIVVYPRSSLLQFHSSASSLEHQVFAEDIEPLIIRDITVRAKKRNGRN